jgi:hypothetical protein
MMRITSRCQQLSSLELLAPYLHHCANGNLLQILTHCVLLAIQLSVWGLYSVKRRHTQAETKYTKCTHLQNSADNATHEGHFGW